MSHKHEKHLRRINAAMTAPALPRLVPERFHPQRDLLLCRTRTEHVTPGGIHLPNKGVGVPVSEVLEVGPDAKGYAKGELIMFAMGAALGLDGEINLIEAGKVLCKVDPPSTLQA